MARRTHSTIDRLPKDLREVMTRMVVDGYWPCEPPEGSGKPTYDDVVSYVISEGCSVSRSAVARWAVQLKTFERMKTAGIIAREAMSGLDDENATQIQKAAAEIITAQVIELAASDDLSSKQIKDVATAIRDCTAVAMKADQYIRSQITAKLDKAAKSATATLEGEGMDRAKIQTIIDDFLGVTKS